MVLTTEQALNHMSHAYDQYAFTFVNVETSTVIIPRTTLEYNRKCSSIN
jgi:hypothetical protein